MNEKKQSRPLMTVLIMVGATMLSKVLGLLREVLFASSFGAGNTLAEAFSSAQSIPSSFFDILFSAAIIGCFIPIYNGFSKEKSEEADRFACAFINLILLLTGALALLGIIFAKQIIALMTPGLDESTASLAATLLRIMFPMIVFTGSAYTLVGVMQSRDRFILPAFISAISNAGVIVYLLFINKALGDNGIYGLAAAYALSWVIQFFTLAIPLYLSGFRFRAIFDFKSEQMKTALKMVPSVMLGSWLLPASLLIGKYFASSFFGVAIFNYANQSYLMIAGILTYSICNYVFPKLSRLSGTDENESFNTTVKTGITSSLFVIIPFASALFVLGTEGICILYKRGAFDNTSAALSGEAIKILALAMPAFALIELLNRMFYSQKKTKAPVIAALSGVAANIISAVILTSIKNDIKSVALACAIGQICTAVILIVFSYKNDKKLFDAFFLKNILKIALGGVIVTVSMKLIYNALGKNPLECGMLANILTAVEVFVPSLIIYVIYSYFIKIRFGKERY